MHIEYGVYLKSGIKPPRGGDGAGTPLITMDTAFSDVPDAVLLQRVLPNAHVVSRSNNRDVQARMCGQGAGVAVLPRPLGNSIPGVRRIDLGEPAARPQHLCRLSPRSQAAGALARVARSGESRRLAN